jgi:hypothetical protein
LQQPIDLADLLCNARIDGSPFLSSSSSLSSGNASISWNGKVALKYSIAESMASFQTDLDGTRVPITA